MTLLNVDDGDWTLSHASPAITCDKPRGEESSCVQPLPSYVRMNGCMVSSVYLIVIPVVTKESLSLL